MVTFGEERGTATGGSRVSMLTAMKKHGTVEVRQARPSRPQSLRNGFRDFFQSHSLGSSETSLLEASSNPSHVQCHQFLPRLVLIELHSRRPTVVLTCLSFYEVESRSWQHLPEHQLQLRIRVLVPRSGPRNFRLELGFGINFLCSLQSSDSFLTVVSPRMNSISITSPVSSSSQCSAT